MNCLIGCLNKKKTRTQKDRFVGSVNNANNAVRYFHKDQNTVYFKYTDCPKLYHIATEKETQLHENSVPIFWQVIDSCCIMLHKLAKAAGGRLVKLKTDCVVIENGCDVHCSPGVGNYL